MSFNLILALSIMLSPAVSVKGTAKTCDIVFMNSLNRPVKLTAEVADTESARSTGLMYRKKLEANKGMIFVFDYEQVLNFWMKNTHIPLSIAYIGSNGVVHDILDMKPLNETLTYPSKRPAKFAVEANRGWFARNNIVPGCRLIINGCLSQ